MNIFSLLAIMGVNLLAAMSPGPDFAVVVRHSINYSRRIGLAAALGVVLGNFVHLFFGFWGISALVQKSAFAQTGIQAVGGAYLLYLGIKGVAASRSAKNAPNQASDDNIKAVSAKTALAAGFVTAATNVKAALYFMGLATTLVTPQLTAAQCAIYVVALTSTTVFWFMSLALLMSSGPLQSRLQPYRAHIETATALALLLLGAGLLWKL